MTTSKGESEVASELALKLTEQKGGQLSFDEEGQIDFNFLEL